MMNDDKFYKLMKNRNNRTNLKDCKQNYILLTVSI